MLSEIGEAGGGVVEAYPEQLDGRGPQRCAYLHTGPESLFEEFGFIRDRRIAKWRWVMRLTVASDTDGQEPVKAGRVPPEGLRQSQRPAGRCAGVGNVGAVGTSADVPVEVLPEHGMVLGDP